MIKRSALSLSPVFTPRLARALAGVLAGALAVVAAGACRRSERADAGTASESTSLATSGARAYLAKYQRLQRAHGPLARVADTLLREAPTLDCEPHRIGRRASAAELTKLLNGDSRPFTCAAYPRSGPWAIVTYGAGDTVSVVQLGRLVPHGEARAALDGFRAALRKRYGPESVCPAVSPTDPDRYYWRTDAYHWDVFAMPRGDERWIIWARAQVGLRACSRSG